MIEKMKEKMNIESAKALWRKRPTSNVEWEKIKKQRSEQRFMIVD